MKELRQTLVDRAPWVIIGLALVVFGAGIGFRDPWPADEPVYSLIARDMLRHGNWLIPMVGGDYFQDKPPLLFWLQAIGYAVTGSYRVGFLLPSLLAGIGTVLLVYDLGRRLWNREAGFHAALLLLFTVQFTLQARRAQLDELLVFFTTLSLYCLLRQLLLGGGWCWAIGAGIAAGLGTLSRWWASFRSWCCCHGSMPCGGDGPACSGRSPGRHGCSPERSGSSSWPHGCCRCGCWRSAIPACAITSTSWCSCRPSAGMSIPGITTGPPGTTCR